MSSQIEKESVIVVITLSPHIEADDWKDEKAGEDAAKAPCILWTDPDFRKKVEV